jgi:hypothetical protein
MKPSQVSNKLRQIAAAIGNSKNPRKDLVAADLRRLVSALDPTINPLGPAPSGYDVGREEDPFAVPVEVALTRGLKVLQSGQSMYELDLPASEGYGSFFEVIDDPVFMYLSDDGTVTVQMGDGYDSETAYAAPLDRFDMEAAVEAILSMAH